MQDKKILKCVAVASAAMIFAIPATAFASKSEQVIGKTLKVTYADLNIANEAGAEQLYRRLRQASKRVCGVESLLITGSLNETSQAKQCFRESISAAVAEINSPLLTKIHKS